MQKVRVAPKWGRLITRHPLEVEMCRASLAGKTMNKLLHVQFVYLMVEEVRERQRKKCALLQAEDAS